MERTTKLIRRSIYIFFQNYHYFTSTAALLLLPVSASILLSLTVESPLLPIIKTQVQSLLDASRFSPSSNLFLFLNHKLSQTIFTFIFTLPFTLSFLLVAKAAVIQALHHKTPPPLAISSLLSLYNPLLFTQVCNTFFVFAANATGLCILILTLNLLDAFGCSTPNFLFFSAAGTVLYSVILTNTVIICNLAVVVAGIENCGGFLAILKACFLIKGRASTALSLALPVNLGLVVLETLFRYRVVRAYRFSNKLSFSAALEGLLIVHLYSLLILIDTIMSCIFYKSCQTGFRIDGQGNYRIEFMGEENNDTFTNLRNLHELT